MLQFYALRQDAHVPLDDPDVFDAVAVRDDGFGLVDDVVEGASIELLCVFVAQLLQRIDVGFLGVVHLGGVVEVLKRSVQFLAFFCQGHARSLRPLAVGKGSHKQLLALSLSAPHMLVQIDAGATLFLMGAFILNGVFDETLARHGLYLWVFLLRFVLPVLLFGRRFRRHPRFPTKAEVLDQANILVFVFVFWLHPLTKEGCACGDPLKEEIYE